jgi:NAD-reducing hydrogenase small subunit
MAKVKVATDWLAACAGCHMSLLDMDAKLVEILDKIELTSCPITDLKHPPVQGVDVGILTGAVNNTTNLAVARMMRKRCKCLVALGDCAVFGGIVAMRNSFDIRDALVRAYEDSESTVDGHIPSSDEIAKPLRAKAVERVVKVDVNVPGCPPSPETIYFVLKELLEGRMPILKDEFLKYD